MFDQRAPPPPSNPPSWAWEGRLRPPWFFRRRLEPAQIGRWGEWVALKHLRRLGWDVLARNWTCSLGELDLVAYDQEDLVVVEVKTRLIPTEFPPESVLDWSKERKMEELAGRFAQRYDLSIDRLRLDLIAVETPDLRSFQLRHYHC